ncbi:Uncharacterised protein [Providencia heimbachae]|uniref:Uncharacterized protein n=1 Tax=Providencia heimbachae ATCC 35613 TaxID=1354272 RepID=A0A1B7JYU7_9GAMM|nr:hypothetical protein M998_1255 [Providencia heimbachae ATCC 35613]SQH14368.1 Uncharacterised protein [Providencia heimbachae]
MSAIVLCDILIKGFEKWDVVAIYSPLMALMVTATAFSAN